MTTTAATHDALLPQPPGGLAGGTALALLVHVVLALALALGLSWRWRAPDAVSAELWAALPQAAAPRAEEPAPKPPPPAPRVEPKPEPQPQQKPEARPAAPTQRDADIAAERLKQQQQQQQQRKAEQDQAEAERRKRLLAQQQQQQQQQQRDAEQQQQKAQDARLVRSREDQLKRMLGALPAASGAPTSTGSAAQDRAPSQAYAGRLVRRLREALIYADQDDPMAEVELRTAPDGSVISRRIVRTSGKKGYDDAVLRAIDRVDRLPADTDGRVPPVITVVFRARDAG